MTTTASATPGHGLEGGLAVGGGEAQVAAVGHPQVGEALPGPVDDAGPLVVAEGGLGQQGHLGAPIPVGLEVVQAVDVLDPLEQAHRGRGHGHGADRLLVAVVAHVEHGVALAGPDLELVVDLGHQRAHGVDHHPAPVPGGRAPPRGPTRGPTA